MREGGEGSGRIPWDSGHVLAFMVVMCDNDDHDVVRVIMMTMVIGDSLISATRAQLTSQYSVLTQGIK